MKSTILTHEQIARRAYQIYLANGCRSGHARDDWLQAEYELLGQPVRILGRMSKRGLSGKIVIAAINGAICLSQLV